MRLSIDLEWWFHALYEFPAWKYYDETPCLQTVLHLLDTLAKHRVFACFYVLGVIAQDHRALIDTIQRSGHRVGSHGWAHRPSEREGDYYDADTRKLLPECVGYRPPYWHGVWRPGYAGGAFFRLLPYPLLKLEALRSQEVYLHPHDLDLHPGMLRRTLSLGDPWQKLERLFREIRFEQP